MKAPLRFCLAISLSLSYLVASASAQVYRAELDFSATSNPNGAWSYGYKTTLTGSFLPMQKATSSVAGLEGWNINGSDMITTAPFVMHNFTSGVVNTTSVHMPNNMLNLHPGPLGQYSVVRWTAPASGGVFDLNGFFQGIDDNTTSSVHVVLGSGAQLYTSDVTGFNNLKTFGLSHYFNPGDTVDFSVGVGSNSTYFSDSTGFDVQIQQAIPETSSASYLLCALALIPAILRQRRR